MIADVYSRNIARSIYKADMKLQYQFKYKRDKEKEKRKEEIIQEHGLLDSCASSTA